MKNFTNEDILEYTNINGYDLLTKIVQEEINLKIRYLKSNLSFSEFYEEELKQYSRIIAQQMLIDYEGKIPQDKYNRLLEFIETDGVHFINKSDFPRTNPNEKLVEAFANDREGKIYLLKLENITDLDEAVSFIRKNKQNLIHEIFHLITKNSLSKRNLDVIGIPFGEYEPGCFFDEAVVEKSTKEFATRHKFLYYPKVSYIEYVLQLESYMKNHGIVSESELFNIPYDELLNYQEYIEYSCDEYYIIVRERKRDILDHYYMNKPNDTNVQKHTLEEEQSEIGMSKNQEETKKYKKIRYN